MKKSNNTTGNPYHDESGKFTSGDGQASSTNDTKKSEETISKIKNMGFEPSKESEETPDVEYDEDYERSWGPKDEEEDEEEIAERIAQSLEDNMWQVYDGVTAGEYAEVISSQLGYDKEIVFDIMKQNFPDLEENTELNSVIK